LHQRGCVGGWRRSGRRRRFLRQEYRREERGRSDDATGEQCGCGRNQHAKDGENGCKWNSEAMIPHALLDDKNRQGCAANPPASVLPGPRRENESKVRCVPRPKGSAGILDDRLY
jgi:hypothetical protein